MAEYTSRSRRVGFLQQADFSTVQAASANFETLSYNAGSPLPNANTINNTLDVTSTSGLIPKESRGIVDIYAGLKTLPFSAPATRKTLAVHFVAALQAVTEVTTTPFQKIITPAYNTAIPDFTAGGYLFTLVTDNKVGSDGAILGTCVLGDFTFSIQPNNEGVARYAQISGTWVGTSIVNNQNLSGTWVAESLTNFYNNTTACTVNITGYASLSAVCWKEYTCTINNNVISDCRGAGAALNLKFAPSITVSVTLPYTDTTYPILEAYRAGTYGSIELSSGLDGAAGYLNILSYGKISAAPIGTDGAYETIKITQAVEYSTANSKSIQVTIADANDRNYPAP